MSILAQATTAAEAALTAADQKSISAAGYAGLAYGLATPAQALASVTS